MDILPNIKGAHILLPFTEFNRISNSNENLLNEIDKKDRISEDYREVLRQVSLFLKYMKGEDFFVKAVDEFNSQSKEAKIHLADGEVRIEILRKDG